MKYVALPHFTKVENKIVKTCAIVAFKKHIPVKVVKDVSLDVKAVQDLVKKLNENEVELVHLFDVIEDFYFEQM
jgi:hypothetical protein